jgi:predicted nucleotidyltransferase component of viral defense system
LIQYASQLKDFPDLLRATADGVGIPFAYVEKDYYIIRALRALRDSIGGQFIFKGGTSLSKGWKLIDRFSEDLDLLFPRDTGTSKGDYDRCLLAAEKIVSELPDFKFIKHTRGDGTHCNSDFSYPRTASEALNASETIKLEMGCRGGHHPISTKPIRSFITEFAEANAHSDLASDLRGFDVDCLDVTRTFVEKLFATHAAFARNRAAGKARHYYDLYQLAGLPTVREFLATDEFVTACSEVRAFSREHFPKDALLPQDGIGQCETFSPGREGLQELVRNYAAELPLFYREPPTIKTILERLQALPFRA